MSNMNTSDWSFLQHKLAIASNSVNLVRTPYVCKTICNKINIYNPQSSQCQIVIVLAIDLSCDNPTNTKSISHVPILHVTILSLQQCSDHRPESTHDKSTRGSTKTASNLLAICGRFRLGCCGLSLAEIPSVKLQLHQNSGSTTRFNLQVRWMLPPLKSTDHRMSTS